MLRKIAASLNERMSANEVLNPPSVDVIVYALSIIWNTVSITVFSLLIGLLTGEFLRTALFLVIFAMFRLLTGGYHLKSGFWCIIVSTAAMSLLPLIQFEERSWIIAGTVLALVMVLLFAPANYDKYARISPKYYPLLKIISALLVATNFLFVSDLLTVACVVQALLLPFKERG